MPPLRCTNAPATARLFVQLSMRRQAVSSGIPILDVLLPLPSQAVGALPVRAHHIASAGRTTIQRQALPFSFERPWTAPAPRNAGASSRTTPLVPAPRAFSTSPHRSATHALLNPQIDEDGNEMILEITPRAAKRLTDIMTKDANPHLALRIQVESGGCHGFQYLMKLVTLPSSLPNSTTSSSSTTTEPSSDSSEIREDDTIFTYTPDESATTTTTGDLTAPKIILDLPSLELLKGSKVDFTMELIGSQFKIVDNPLATSSCGCGTSFDIKI